MSLPILVADGDDIVRSQFSGDTVDEIMHAGGVVFGHGGEYGYNAEENPEKPYFFRFYGRCKKREEGKWGALLTLGECVEWFSPPFTRWFKDLEHLAMYAAFDTEEHS